MRVRSWYARGELAPQPELSLWELQPERMLSELAELLRSDEWTPDSWLQVPYPKKGQRLRHYLKPTVRDQVAFMTHMVLIGPILDCQTENFAFGNRWYRPIRWDMRRTNSPGRWVHMKYPILNGQSYLPYARSHGLFRRVAHWTVARMTQAPLSDQKESSRRPQFDDYDSSILPEWTRAEWWHDSTNATTRAYWAGLDIEQAFPSVRLRKLDTALRRAVTLKGIGVVVPKLFEGCPDTVSNELKRKDVRIEICKRLSSALQNITVKNSVIPPETWMPPSSHSSPNIATDQYDGLPTGLIISGILLNVVLRETDQKVQSYLVNTHADSPSAFLRFADDMYVLSTSQEALLALIEEVHGALSGSQQSNFAKPNASSNLGINFNKIKPEAVRELLGVYLKQNNWKDCESCEQPLKRKYKKTKAEKISEWVNSDRYSVAAAPKKEKVDGTAIQKKDLGPFVTSLVERMSDIGQDTLRQRFGEGAREYLARLHELARFNIDDEQVRPDTLRAFSINRLVRAWLPRQQNANEEQWELQQIRETLSFALDTMPWKFTAWRAIVRGTARLSNKGTSSGEEDEWLIAQLQKIACTTDTPDKSNWLASWPEKDEMDVHVQAQRDDGLLLYTSYLRAAFWQALAAVIRSLRRHAVKFDESTNPPSLPLPHLWTVRALPEGRHNEVADRLSKLDTWVKILYPNSDETSLAQWPWELDEFVKCVLAIHSKTEITIAWQQTEIPDSTLKVPNTEKLSQLPFTSEIIRESNRLLQDRSGASTKLNRYALAHVGLAHDDAKFETTLFPKEDSSVFSKDEIDPSDVLAIAQNLRCFERVSLDLANKVLPSSSEATQEFSRDVLKFQDYVRARKVIAGQYVAQVDQPTIHRLLWGSPIEQPLSKWELVPWETPALGLPTLVATKLFIVARSLTIDSRWNPSDGPVIWEIDDYENVLGTGRYEQLLQLHTPRKNTQNIKISKSIQWEVPPNAAFYRPFLVVRAKDVCRKSYALYCDVLLLLTLLDGDERILHRLATRGVGGTPFEDRWAWRSGIHLPKLSWRLIEEILRWSDTPSKSVVSKGASLVKMLEHWSGDSITNDDFLPERVDVGLHPSPDLDVVRAITSSGELSNPNLPKELMVTPEYLHEEFLVRVGQIDAWPDKTEIVRRFPNISSDISNSMIEQVCNAFLAPAQFSNQESLGVVVLPELSIPAQEVFSLRSLVKNENKGVVAGLYWRYVHPPFKPSMEYTPRWRYFVNEVEIVLPFRTERGPTSIRWFRVQKPVSSHIEDGLAQAVSNGHTRCRLLRGRRWYRFVHPHWGAFTIGICSDLIDSAPWRALRGELLHLMMVAFNKDVELFDSLTWVRAYENYTNVVSVNHGRFGGSFIWTPKSKHSKELARLRGSDLVLTADIRLPVKSLYEAQSNGVESAVKREANRWCGNRTTESDFKSPPPGFRPRNS